MSETQFYITAFIGFTCMGVSVVLIVMEMWKRHKVRKEIIERIKKRKITFQLNDKS